MPSLDRGLRRVSQDAMQSLRNTQNAEMWAIRNLGLDKETRQAERQSNRDERKALKTSLSGLTAENASTFQLPSTMTATTAPGTERVQALLQKAQDARTKYNLPGVTRSGSVTKGFGAVPLVKYFYAQDAGTTNAKDPYTQMLQRAEANWGKSLTADEIAKNGNLDTIKAVKGQDGVFSVNRGYSVGNNDKMRISDIYKQNADGTYTLTGFNRVHQDIANNKNGLGTVIGLAGLAAFGLPAFGVPGLATASIPAAANTVGSIATTAAGQAK